MVRNRVDCGGERSAGSCSPPAPSAHRASSRHRAGRMVTQVAETNERLLRFRLLKELWAMVMLYTHLNYYFCCFLVMFDHSFLFNFFIKLLYVLL
jgi:hypothetical protein